MFFTKYATAEEQARGTAEANLLVARYRENAEEFFGDSAIGMGAVEASIAVGDKIYELTIELSRIPREEDGIYLMEMGFDPETREMGNGFGHYLPGAAAPLTWPTLVSVLCEKFGLDPAVVWNTGVDVLAHFQDQAYGEMMKVPREADRAKYALATLHRGAN